MTQPQRAGVYCRLSYAPDGSEEKVDRQEGDCRELAARLRWPISDAHVFKDNSRSAWQRNRRRPAWDRMLAAVEAGEIDAIIVYHGDRLIRQPYDLEKLIGIADRRGVRIASPSGTRDLDSPDDRFILRIEAAQACRESDNISRRVRRTLSAKAERGHTQNGGRRPFGFGVQVGVRTRVDRATGQEEEVPVYDTCQHVPEEAKLLAAAVERLLSGQKQISVVRWLNTKCTTTAGGEWTTKTFRDLMLRPRIAGLIDHQGVMVKAAWDPIIPVETWQDVQALYQRSREVNPYPGRERRYLLSTVAECGGCQTAMRGRPVGGKDAPRRRTRWAHYYCPGCKKVSRKVDHVDAYVEGRVLRLLNDDRLLAELQATTGDGDGTGLAAEITALERRKQALAAQIEDAADHPDVDPVLAMKSIASYDRKISELRNRLAVTASQRRLSRMLGFTREQWEAEPLEVRSLTVRDLYRVVIMPTQRRGPGFDPDTVELTRRPLLDQ